MNIAVVGTGYVGLVTGTCFAETGNNVTCVDIDRSKVDKLSGGEITIYEPGLEKLFLRNQKEGRIKFTTQLAEAVQSATIVFLALPTPPGEDGSADLQYVLKVAKDLGAFTKDGAFKVIIDKSTVPVGTADKVHEAIIKNGGNEENFCVVSNPEFLREGVAVDDFMKPDRVVIGTDREEAIEILTRLYAPFVRQGNPLLFMDVKSAELTKYAANAFLAMKISFMNEIAQLCEKLDADVDMVRRGIGSDDRIGKRFLFPGIGYGGSCFPKDVQALAKSSKDIGYSFKILDAVMEVNELQKHHLLNGIEAKFGTDLSGKHFGIWGLSFKPNTDDIRDAPAFVLIEKLLGMGATVSAFDPEAMNNSRRVLGDKITFCENQYEALEDSDALLIATEWNEFRTPDFAKIKELLKSPVIFDGRNLFNLQHMEEQGFYYKSIGRKTVEKA